MPSVGPELPPHLAKRKRSIEESEPPNSPPHKITAATPRVLGPALPSKNLDELEVDPSSDDEYGPSVSAVKPTSRPSPPPRQVLGPTAPPAPISQMPSAPANAEDSSSDDDDYGPAPPPAPGSEDEARMIRERERVCEEERVAAIENPAKPQRAEWMLIPPTDSDWTSRVDPTKMKNRKFASGKGAKAPAERGGISDIWTETPDQKRKRLEDEILGRKDAATSSRANKKNERTESKGSQEIARRIAEYNEKHKENSMVAEHQEKKGIKDEEDDPSKRVFDREKDMAIGGISGHTEKRELLAKAKDYGSRFEKGKYL
ncbi:hypothetical protein BJ878DRAFT_487942 [Calycina marina]|uniref:DUF3752 domain-containing protein n=1 Tax=Calycina marina TaxID=1763456 RepID=A0A9P8CIM9_9HELO|nr:hypothetical protein BJ878DRAFT_487942 [Calycina marina]